MNTVYRTRLQLLLGGIAVVALVGGFLALHARPSPATVQSTLAASAAGQTPVSPTSIDMSAQALANVQLHYAKAELRPAMHTIAATGVVAFNAKRLAQLGSPSKGRVISIDVATGDRVRAGQRLATLDDFDLGDVRNQVATASAAMSDARTSAEAANAALQRGAELLATGGIAQSELDRRRVAAADAQAALDARRADLQKWLGMRDRLMPIGLTGQHGRDVAPLARLSPHDTLGALVAPFDGVVNSVNAAEGDMVEVSTPVVTIADLSTMWVQANVPERDASEVRPGQAAAVRIDAYPGRVFTARVIDVATQADPNTGTVAVRCEVPNSDGALRANLFASVDIDVPLGREAVLVPDSALQDVNGQTAVFTPSGNGRFAWHAVHTGYASQGMTEIVSGLSAGAPVVAEGSYWLKAAVMTSAIPNE